MREGGGTVEVERGAFVLESKLVSIVVRQFSTLAAWRWLERQRVWKKSVVGSRVSTDVMVIRKGKNLRNINLAGVGRKTMRCRGSEPTSCSATITRWIIPKYSNLIAKQ